MEKYKNISTLLFDLGGVILDLDRSNCIESFKQIGIPDMDKRLDDCIQTGFFLDFEIGKIPAAQFRNEIRTLSQEKLSDEAIDKAWNGFLIQLPSDRLELLLKLRERFTVLMLSNTSPIHTAQWKKMFKEANGLDHTAYFDKCYLSYEIGAAKPSAAVFEAVLKDAQIAPENCLFFDDGARNIEQAKKMGFQTRLVTQGEDLSFLLNVDTWE